MEEGGRNGGRGKEWRKGEGMEVGGRNGGRGGRGEEWRKAEGVEGGVEGGVDKIEL